VKSKKPNKGRVANGKSPPHPLDQIGANEGNSGNKVSDHSSSPERHLPSWQNITKKSSAHKNKVNKHTNIPHFPLRKGAIVKPTTNVKV